MRPGGRELMDETGDEKRVYETRVSEHGYCSGRAHLSFLPSLSFTSSSFFLLFFFFLPHCPPLLRLLEKNLFFLVD